MTDLDALTDAWDRLAPGPPPVEEMLRAHHAHQAVRRRRRLAVVGGVAAAAVVAASLAVQAQRTSPGPARPAPSPAAPTPTADTAPAPTPPAVPLPADRSTVYFVLAGSGLPYVGLVPMTVPTGRGEPVVRAVQALLTVEPPHQAGFAGTGNPWLGDEGEARATLRSVDRGDGLVVVDLATVADSLRTGLPPDLGPGGQLPLLQVACTAQRALATADPVRITLRGAPVRLFSRDASRPRVCPEQLLTGSAGAPDAG